MGTARVTGPTNPVHSYINVLEISRMHRPYRVNKIIMSEEVQLLMV